jgi:hypothetical protein
MTSSPLRYALAVALVPSVLAGCGGGSSQPPKPAKKITIKTERFGEQTQVSVTKEVDAGVQELTFTNAASGEHSAQLLRYDQGHDPQEALKAGNDWGERGKPLPSWLHLEGGFGNIDRGATRAGAVNLEPGSYMVLDLEATRQNPVYSTFIVRGKPSQDPLPATKATIQASEYKFTSTGLTAGATRVLFKNSGKEPHHVAAAPLADGATLADVREFLKTERGEPPIEESSATDTAVVDGGKEQVLELDLKRGTYALLCFVPDRKGGPPHAVKGMVSEAEVR